MDLQQTTLNSRHSYATRIRQNILIKPSPRLDPLPSTTTHKLNKHNTSFPIFPIPGIVLHPEDAHSKVFLAIGRSFLSVDNRAMTIKDLAELTVNFGLVCQNLSAASQAITTYIRAHMQRCDLQQDQPLLLRHTLSGTQDDDDLLPALYSRSGGAHSNNTNDAKITNFRRGTVVWYMSRTTGAPCPFARAGIRLCDYGEDGKAGAGPSSNEKKKPKEKDRLLDFQHCGQKRKRPLRGCVAKGLDSDHDPERPPPKVKLTLRLKPLHASRACSITHVDPTGNRVIDLSKDSISSDSDSSQDGSMSVDFSSSESDDDDDDQQQRQRQHHQQQQQHQDRTSPPKEESWSLPPYPRKSISIPGYVPAPTSMPYLSSSSSPINRIASYRRSPSIPYSIGSPPPDSEDEDDDFHITMTGARRHSTDPRSSAEDPDGWDADLDSEGDGEMWESPGPRSPSAPVVLPEVTVKEEPTDVQGMLEAWEDFDSSLAGAKVVEVLAQAAAGVLGRGESTSHVKTEPIDSWSWESSYTDPSQEWPLTTEGELTARIKEEDVDLDSPFQHHIDSPPVSPLSTHLLYSDGGSRDATEWNDNHFATIRPHANNFSYLNSSSPPPPPPPTSFSLPLTPQRQPTTSRPDLVLAPVSSVSLSLATLIQSLSMNSPTAIVSSSLLVPPSCISPHETRGNSFSDVVVVHTCKPCTPAISATQIEGISVYQMMLGAFQLLRRIDTDFVNLSPIVAYSGAPWPVIGTIPNATIVAKGSPVVSGTWVPLAAAQAYVRDHQQLLQIGPLSTFLSDTLFERFPSALQDFHRSSTQGRMLGHFGPHFGSTLQATQLCGAAATEGIWESREEEPVPHISNASSSPAVLPLSDRSIEEETELPLSVTEQEIFHALCDIPEWDKENSAPSSPKVAEHKLSTAAAAAAVFVPASGSSEGTQSKGTLTERVRAPTSTTTTTTATATEATVLAAGSGRPERALPLRRSKRVADAIAAQTQTRTRSRRGGSRNSLS